MRIIGCIYTLDNRRSRCWIPTPANCKTRPSNIRGETVREFYSALSGPILVGIEATGSMQWFLELMEELGIECRVGHPQKIRKAETRKQKHDRRDARLLLTLLTENRFPTIWMPSTEQRDLRTLLRHRHQWECPGDSGNSFIELPEANQFLQIPSEPVFQQPPDLSTPIRIEASGLVFRCSFQ